MDGRSQSPGLPGARIIKIIALLMTVVMFSFLFAACGNQGEEQSAKAPGTVISETDDQITIVDQAGREVSVKKGPESIALCYRVVVRFLLSLDQGDHITGIGKSEDFLEMIQPSLKDCTDVGKGVADIEALAELKPDVFFHKAADVETLEAVEKIGIPAVGIEVETPEDMVMALTIMGKICDEEEKANELIAFYDAIIQKAEERTANLKEKKTAIVMGSSIGKVADGSMLQGEMLKRAGAINSAEDLEATELWPTAGTEQIFAWNPDYIFITNSESAVYDADDIMNDKAWSEMKAVKEGHVYVMPAALDSWEFPGIVSALGIEYMMHTIYPELLSEEELVKDVSDFYELSYDKTFERSTLGY